MSAGARVRFCACRPQRLGRASLARLGTHAGASGRHARSGLLVLSPTWPRRRQTASARVGARLCGNQLGLAPGQGGLALALGQGRVLGRHAGAWQNPACSHAQTVAGHRRLRPPPRAVRPCAPVQPPGPGPRRPGPGPAGLGLVVVRARHVARGQASATSASRVLALPSDPAPASARHRNQRHCHQASRTRRPATVAPPGRRCAQPAARHLGAARRLSPGAASGGGTRPRCIRARPGGCRRGRSCSRAPGRLARASGRRRCCAGPGRPWRRNGSARAFWLLLPGLLKQGLQWRAGLGCGGVGRQRQEHWPQATCVAAVGVIPQGIRWHRYLLPWQGSIPARQCRHATLVQQPGNIET